MIKTDIYNFCNLVFNWSESLDKRYSDMFALSEEVIIIKMHASFERAILVGIFAP